MTRPLAILLIAAFGLAAQAPASTGSTAKETTTKATPKAAAKTAKAAVSQAVTIPKDAILNSDGTYSWKDKDGSRWLFLKTPFGIMKTSMEEPGTKTSPSNRKAFDEGDKVRFELTTPIGVMTTEKKKSDLTDEDRALLNSQTAAPAAKQN